MTPLSRRTFCTLPAAARAARIRCGHHFWNWPREWNADIDRRLRLTRETGWEGFESSPEEIGVPARLLKPKCEREGVLCVGVSGPVKEAIDYGHTVGARFARSSVPVGECSRWVEYAAERSMLIVVHNHIGPKGKGSGSVETREDLLRYLDARPGTYACPDTGHLLLCGSDPVQTIRDLGERCRYVHLKDLHPKAAGTGIRDGRLFCELGAGALDLKGVMNALEAGGRCEWVMAEYGGRGIDTVESARKMRRALSRLGY